MIRTVYRSGEEDLVTPKFLDILIYLGQVQMFKRSDGWVVVGVDPLRSQQKNLSPVAERRRHKPTSLPSLPINPDFWTRSSFAAE
jgi:superfamily I DNA and RNA helicase